MDRNIIGAALAALLLCACAGSPTESAHSDDLHPPPYVVSECANVIAELQPLYKNEAETGEADLRIGALESRGEVMGCDPRKYLPAQ